MWVVHTHPDVVGIEAEPRAVVAPLPALTNLVEAWPRSSSECGHATKIYDVGATAVHGWTCAPGSFAISSWSLWTKPGNVAVSDAVTTTSLHVVEGAFVVTSKDGSALMAAASAGDPMADPCKTNTF